MKTSISSIFVASALFFSSCTSKDAVPAASNAPFSAKLGTEVFTSPDAKLMIAASNTIAAFAKDSKGRTFGIAIFEKDFPFNKAVNVAFSPSISYIDEKKAVYIAESGTMTIISYTKNSAGTVTNIKGIFGVVLTAGVAKITVTDGKFDLSK